MCRAFVRRGPDKLVLVRLYSKGRYSAIFTEWFDEEAKLVFPALWVTIRARSQALSLLLWCLP